MTKEMAEFLKGVCDENGAECTIYEDYSGRGMYGETTTGIVVSSVLDVLSAVLEYMADNIEVGEQDYWFGGTVLRDGLSEFRQDNMGTNTIVY
jgi:hypothetical protein